MTRRIYPVGIDHIKCPTGEISFAAVKSALEKMPIEKKSTFGDNVIKAIAKVSLTSKL